MYEDFYHLRAKPFRLSPDPGFFFASRGHKRALAYLRYGLSQDEGFVVITGAPGTGKTTLAQILLKEMDQSHLIVAHLTTSQLEADELLRMVLASFGLRYDGVNKAGMLKTMEAFLLARSRERKRVLLVVDEAQNLPPTALEELRMLSNLQVGDKALVQTFLLGQAQFRAKLDHPDLEQFRQRVIANYHLGELAEDECQNYIETRLRHVGWAGDPAITAGAYKGIYNYTQGIPRRINMLCDRLMLFSFLEERHQIDEAVFNSVTDELQQEISGKPIERSKPSSDEVETINATLDEQQNSVSSENKSNTADVAKADVAKKEEAKKVEAKKAPTESEVLHRIPEKLSTPPVITPPEGNKLNKAVPDVGYDELVARAQTDNAETMDDEKGGDQNKERFQVINGGRDEPEIQVDNVTVPLIPPDNIVAVGENTTTSSDSQESDEVILRKILRLVLAYHRSPRSFPGLQDPIQPLPKGITQILTLANADDETLKNFRQITAMGISPAMLRAAVRFFVRRVMFLPGGDEYRALGLPSGANQDQIENHYGLLMRLMRQEKRSAEESSVNRIGEAYENLCRGVSTSTLKEPTVESIPDIDSENVAGEADKLDLDLSPVGMNEPDKRRQGLDPMGFSLDDHVRNSNEIIISKNKSRFNITNIMLTLGAVVVVAVLYFTQMPSHTTPEAENKVATTTDTTQDTAASQPNNEEASKEAITTTESTVTDQDKATQEAEALKQAKLKEQAKLEEESKQAQLAKAAAEKKAQQEAEERAKADAAKAAAQAKAKAAAEAEAKAVAEAKAKAAAEAKAKAKAVAEAKAKAAAEARHRAELKAQQEVQARAKAVAEARAKAAKATVASVAPIASAKIASTQASTAVSDNGAGNPGTAELNNVLASLERAYRTGNLDQFLKLFSKNPRTNNHTDLSGLRDEYRSFFTRTDLRNLTFRNIDWDIEFNYALGTGKYEQIVKSRDKPEKLLKKGKATIQLEHEDGQMKITRLYFSDPESVTKLKVDTSVLATEGVLNGMLDKFVKTYEQGQIEPFMSLFSENAKTNDRVNPAGIRKDYVGLFSGTSMRKMTLKNMKWEWEDGTARSTGDFTVEVQAKGKQKANTYKGKLWFEVTLIKGQPKISYFAFKTG